MPALALIFCICFLGILTSICVLAITGHWVFGGLMLAFALMFVAIFSPGKDAP